jgi:hypothetical protein
MSSEQASSSKSLSPRFFYGRAKNVFEGKRGYQLCLADMETEKVIWFEKPFQLFEKIKEMVKPFLLQNLDLEFTPRHGKIVSSEVLAEDLSDYSVEADEMIDRGQIQPVFQLLPGMIRGQMKSVELTEEFNAHQELQDYLDKLWDEPLLDDFVDADEIEPDEKVYEPFFTEKNFTCETGHLPLGLLVKYEFFDVKSLAVQLKIAKDDFDNIKNEVAVIFHPEKAEALKRSRGLCGFNSPSSVNADEFAGKDNI